MKVSDLIRTEPETTITGRHNGRYQATFLDGEGAGLITDEGATREAAESTLLQHVRASLQGDSTPRVLLFRGETIVVWRNQRFWVYGFIRNNSTPHSTVLGCWDRKEAERQARRHLAQSQWDGLEETSPIITCDKDQQEFATWARHEKAYKQLCAHGWHHEEALNIISGCAHFVTSERINELGDPSIVLAQKPTTPSEPYEGVLIRVLPYCGNTLLQITTTLQQARFIQFTHLDHTSRTFALCTHEKPSGGRIQTILKNGDRGTITIDVGKFSHSPILQEISFLVLDVELAEIVNQHNLPLKIEIV